MYLIGYRGKLKLIEGMLKIGMHLTQEGYTKAMLDTKCVTRHMLTKYNHQQSSLVLCRSQPKQWLAGHNRCGPDKQISRKGQL
jgi:hypothetical protein